MGPNEPSVATRESDTMADMPVFSRANDIGIMAAIRTMLSQFILR